MIPVADDAAVGKRKWRLVTDGLRQEIAEIGERIQALKQMTKPGGPQPCENRCDRRQAANGRAQGSQLAGTSSADRDFAQEALEIENSVECAAGLFEHYSRGGKFSYGIQSRFYLFGIKRRPDA